MRISVTKKITDSLINNGVITYQDKDLYTYGLKQGFLMILNIITAILIGILFGMVWQSLVFLLAYIPLRTYAGGYHAKTQLRCYLFSIVIMSAALLGIKLIPLTSFICLIITLISGGVIFLLAPVEDRNKPLDQTERKVFKSRTGIILFFDIATLQLMLVLGQQQLSVCILMVLVILSIMLILGKIKEGRHSYEKFH
ncbi:MAG: putative processing-secretion protein [Lachnospiraceae bacterium]|jgi:accessory gene regulator B|nr:putative processing-secretion protein [Lachnospiraceae bacterium]